MSEYKMTIIVPVYNEVENLDRLKRTFDDYFSKSPTKSKVLFVDDGSNDGSFSKIKSICKNNNEFEYIRFKNNFGLSSAIKAGIDFANTDYIGYIDADLQTSPYDFDKLLQFIENYDAVVGFRIKRKDGINKKVQSYVANSIRRRLINDGIKDTGCPLKVIRNDIAKKIPFFDGMHRFIPALIQLQGGKVKQIPVKHYERIAGKSKFNIFNRSVKPLQDTFAYRWMKSRYIKYKTEEIYLK